MVASGGESQVRQVLGCLSQNYPSITDVAIDIYRSNSFATSTSAAFSTGATTGFLSLNVDDFLQGQYYTPELSPILYTESGGGVTNGITGYPGLQLNPAAVAGGDFGSRQPMQELDELLLVFANNGALADTLMVMFLGTYQLVQPSLFAAVAFYGSFTAVNNFIQYSMRGTRIASAWGTPSIPSNPDTTAIMALCGVDDDLGFVFVTNGGLKYVNVSSARTVEMGYTNTGGQAFIRASRALELAVSVTPTLWTGTLNTFSIYTLPVSSTPIIISATSALQVRVKDTVCIEGDVRPYYGAPTPLVVA
jgi:hypothetical protein